MFEEITFIITSILDLTFSGDGLAAALGFFGISVALALMWGWTQYLVTETIQDLREWRQKRKAIKDLQNA